MPRFFHAHETARADELDGVRLASFGRRALGFGIDSFIVVILRKLVAFAWRAYIPPGRELHHTLIDFAHILSLLVLIAYFSLALYVGDGQTPGKWLLRTRVLSLTHQRITFWQALERALGYAASFLELGFGFAQFFLNRNQQCAHDRLAETIVADARVLAPRGTPAHLPQSEPSPSARPSPPLADESVLRDVKNSHES